MLPSILFPGSLWSRGWENDPTSVLPIGMPLSPITRATVVIFSELGLVVSVFGTPSDSLLVLLF